MTQEEWTERGASLELNEVRRSLIIRLQRVVSAAQHLVKELERGGSSPLMLDEVYNRLSLGIEAVGEKYDERGDLLDALNAQGERG